MGTELMRISVKKESDEIPSVPPGFESFAAFSLRRVQDDENQESTNASSSSSPASASESQTIQMETEFDSCSVAKVSKPLRHRPLINYEQLDNRPEETSDTLKRDQNLPLKPHLPKGVIRGCPECSNCQKVNARWSPEYACRPDLEDAPVFYPTEEEFEDTLTYIGRIRPKAEPYGICRIVPPPSWKPPFCLREKTIWESSTFATRVQRVDKLQNRVSMRKLSKTSSHNRKKRRRCMGMAVDCGTESGSNAALSEAGTFGFDAGPEFTLNTFQNYADYFKAQYFRKNDSASDDGNTTIVLPENWEPTVGNIEGEYWRIIEKATEEIEVLYGADLETGVFGSGFPKKSSEVSSGENEWYAKSGWNLNNFPRLPGSLLSYESGDISGVLVPWLYIGMCFSSFCWHVEDHHLYSLNYMHWGAPKMWYGVPGKDAIKFEEAMRKYLPDLFEEQPDLLHKLVTQLSPSILKSEGVPVYRCVQNSGEFVLTFPRAYHAGFNCGFNCAEAVNVAPVDWLPHGQTAIELYRDQGRRTSISHDKLLLGAAREAVRANWEVNLLKKNTSDNLRWKSVCGKGGILAKALKMRVEMERDRREFLCNSSQALKMDSNFDATSERECSVCLFDLHLSAAGCGCSPDKYTCLNHAKQLCSCSWGPKFFLFRYDTSELNILVEALEGKLSAVYRWARMDLGLALTSYVSQRNILDSKFSDSPKRAAIEEVKAHPPANVLKDFLGKVVAGDLVFTSTGFFGDTTLEERKKLLEAATLKEMVTSSASHTSKVIKKEILDLTIDKEEHMEASTAVCQLSQEDTSYALNLTSDQYEGKKSSTLGHDTVILLSDDEGDELQKPLLERATENTLAKREITCGLAAKRCYSDNTTSNLTIIIPAVSGYQCTIKNSTLKHSGFSDGQSSSCSDSCKDGEHPVLTAPIPAIDAEPFGEKNVCLSPYEKSIDCTSDVVLIREVINEQSSASSFPDRHSNTSLAHPVPVKEECIGAVLGSCPLSNSCLAGCTNAGSARNLQDSSNMRTTVKGQSMPNTENQQTRSCGIGNPNNVGKMGANAPAVSVENSRVMAGSSSCSQNNLDRYFRQKGPRIAKVVRRINCHVEPLEFGVVLSGKLWCNSQAIFPKGFRSRVKYISVLDPTSMCYYVSEILEAGQNGPVFMVSLEDCPSEVFIHISAARCWEMVRERVNQEISRQHKLGKMNLPPLQPPGSLDGLEMFGFSSPAIVQAVEALDRKRICTDYWDSRPYSRPQGQIPLHSQYGEIRGGSFQGTHGEQSKNHLLPNGLDITLRGLFKKANQEELCSLSRILSDDSISDRGLIKLINEEIHSRPR